MPDVGSTGNADGQANHHLVNGEDVVVEIPTGHSDVTYQAHAQPGVVIPAQPHAANHHGANPEAASTDGSGCMHRGNCCVLAKQCFESSITSFIIGGILFVGGIVLIAVASSLPSGDYFLIGPFSVAAGTIFFIRGCINKMAKRQERIDQANVLARENRRAMTRDQRSQRNEELALSQENLIIPPEYGEVVTIPKPVVVPPSHRQMVNTGSQADFGNDLPLHRTMSTQAAMPPALTRLASVQSQTSFPSMVSVAVDTSDLPVQLDTTSQAPPSYYRATHLQREPPSRTSMHTVDREPASVDCESSAVGTSTIYYLPEDGED